MDWNTELWLTLRILLAAVLGGIIGWERETHNRDAGIRTYMAVAVGSCTFCIVSTHIPTLALLRKSCLAWGSSGRESYCRYEVVYKG
jgi:uncharacterized membrane protein YhiD involved in acid resistance